MNFKRRNIKSYFFKNKGDYALRLLKPFQVPCIELIGSIIEKTSLTKINKNKYIINL